MGPPSRLNSRWSNPEVASEAVQVTTTVVFVIDAPSGGEAIERDGGVVSTVTDTEAASELPAPSTAVTSSVWLPSERPDTVYPVTFELSVTGAPPSTRSSK